MADYIERESTVELLRGLGSRDYRRKEGTIQDAIKMIQSPAYTPSADVVEVVHGRWQRVGIFKKEGPIYPCCSACGIVSAAYRSQWEGLQGPWSYCPNCGAKMDGGIDDATD